MKIRAHIFSDQGHVEHTFLKVTIHTHEYVYTRTNNCYTKHFMNYHTINHNY